MFCRPQLKLDHISLSQIISPKRVMLEMQNRRLSVAGIKQLFGREADVAQKHQSISVESASLTIRAPMEEIWAVVKKPGLYTR